MSLPGWTGNGFPWKYNMLKAVLDMASRFLAVLCKETQVCKRPTLILKNPNWLLATLINLLELVPQAEVLVMSEPAIMISDYLL